MQSSFVILFITFAKTQNIMSNRILLYILFILLNLNGFLQNVQWAKGINFTQTNPYPGINYSDGTVDKHGNTYTIGYFLGTTDFDPGPSSYTITSTYENNYILKLDSLGNFVLEPQTSDDVFVINLDKSKMMQNRAYFGFLKDRD